MKISQIINKKNLESQEEIELLRDEIERYLAVHMTRRSAATGEQSNKPLSPDQMNLILHKLKREENTKRILQYMLSFLSEIPVADKTCGEPTDPIQQFQECVHFEVDLLQAEDVKDAVFNEINQMGSTHGGNVWDYMGRIIEKNRELNEALITGASDAASNLFTLCLVLEDLCLFWFDVKQENMRRIRLSDIFIFKLARILQGRCRQT
jgi:hypothetical protein